MQASLYDWIVYQRKYKTKERKGEKKTSGAVGLFKYQKGRQGASSKRANGNVAEYGRSFVRSFCHMAPGLPSSTVLHQCRNKFILKILLFKNKGILLKNLIFITYFFIILFNKNINKIIVF